MSFAVETDTLDVTELVLSRMPERGLFLVDCTMSRSCQADHHDANICVQTGRGNVGRAGRFVVATLRVGCKARREHARTCRFAKDAIWIWRVTRWDSRYVSGDGSNMMEAKHIDKALCV